MVDLLSAGLYRRSLPGVGIAGLSELMVSSEEESNFETFRDCLSTVVIEKLAPATAKPKKRVKGRKNEIKPVVAAGDGETDAADLSEFTEVGLASCLLSEKYVHVAKGTTSTSPKRHFPVFLQSFVPCRTPQCKMMYYLRPSMSRHWMPPCWNPSSNLCHSASRTP